MFYERLNTICNENNITVTKLLKDLNLSTSKGTAWKNGSIPNGDTLSKIADYFDVSVDYLLGVEKPHKPINNMLRTPEEEAELNEYLEALHNDPNLRMMFSLAKDAKKEDVEKAVAIIKTLLGKD